MEQKNYIEIARELALKELNQCRKSAGLRPLSELPASGNSAENNKSEQRITPIKKLSITEVMQRDQRKSVFKRV